MDKTVKNYCIVSSLNGNYLGVDTSSGESNSYGARALDSACNYV